MKNYGEMIRNARLSRNMTQDDLAEKLHVTRQTVSNYETGKSQPDIAALGKLAQILDLDLNALAGRQERKQPDVRWHWIALALLIISGSVLGVYITKVYEKQRMYFIIPPEFYITRYAVIPYIVFAACALLGSIAVIYAQRTKETAAGIRILIRTAGVLFITAMALYAVILVYLRAHSSETSVLLSTLASLHMFFVHHPHLIRITGVLTGILNGLITDREYNPLYLASPTLILFIFCVLKYGVL